MIRKFILNINVSNIANWCHLALIVLVVTFSGCMESKKNNSDEAEEARQLLFDEKKEIALDFQTVDDLHKLVLEAVKKSTAKSIKTPKLVYANFDRSILDRPILAAQWVGDSATYVDEVCVRLSDGEILAYDCIMVRKQNEDYLTFGFERYDAKLDKKLKAQKMPGAIVFLKRNGVVCSEEVPLWERLRMKERKLQSEESGNHSK